MKKLILISIITLVACTVHESRPKQRVTVDLYQGHGQPPRTVRLIVHPSASTSYRPQSVPPNRFPMMVGKPKKLQ